MKNGLVSNFTRSYISITSRMWVRDYLMLTLIPTLMFIVILILMLISILMLMLILMRMLMLILIHIPILMRILILTVILMLNLVPRSLTAKRKGDLTKLEFSVPICGISHSPLFIVLLMAAVLSEDRNTSN